MRCSGHQECAVTLPDVVFLEEYPCDKELRVYLEVAYSCVKGMWEAEIKRSHFLPDVLMVADSKCSSRQVCEIEVPDPALDEMNPCDEELRVYLSVSYACVQGMWD